MKIYAAALLVLGVSSVLGASASLEVVPEINANVSGGLYTPNKDPLLPAPLLKLPPGAVTPRGWLRHQLELQREGMTGRLAEISPWLRFDESAWSNSNGEGKAGWEEMPYWLKGYGDLGYVLKDDAIIKESRKWIDAAMASQREDGWFGPRDLLTSLKGKPDLWPHMVMLNILQSYYEFSGDARVISTMMRYAKWEDQLPPSAFGEGYWPKLRAGDNIESLLWLYNRTGEKWLLDLARKIHENMARWDEGVVNWHNVNIAQGFRASAMFYPLAKQPALLAAADRNYRQVMDIYGQFPGGGFAGDENCREGYIDPRQGFETCGYIEFLHSFQMLTRISGSTIWSDRAEDIAFNSLPAALTPDQRSLHYLTCANQVQMDRHNKAPGIQNGGTMFSYSPFEVYRCCQHNVSHGWPYYAEELWAATHDAGLCASLYAPSEVTAKVADGTSVTILQETEYPFGDVIRLRISSLTKPAAFPLYLRIPGWCGKPQLKVNKQKLAVSSAKGYLRVNRTWQNDDVVELTLPMEIKLRTWAKNQNSVSVDRGPLTYSLQIKERWEKYGKNEQWPEWEVFADSPWNYGLVLDTRNPADSFKLKQKRGALPAQPFVPEAVPVSLTAKARKIPQWQLDRNNLLNPLQASPVKSSERLETVTLIPMGAARLRITSFPVIGSGPAAHNWVEPPKPKPGAYKTSASHCNESDRIDALSDGLLPKHSNDHEIPRFTWWSRKGSAEWVQFDFKAAMPVRSVWVYWFDDTGAGQCRVPKSWRILYREGEEWKPVTADYTVLPDTMNKVRFTPIQTTALRLEAQLQEGFSGGILEWQVNH